MSGWSQTNCPIARNLESRSPQRIYILSFLLPLSKRAKKLNAERGESSSSSSSGSSSKSMKFEDRASERAVLRVRGKEKGARRKEGGEWRAGPMGKLPAVCKVHDRLRGRLLIGYAKSARDERRAKLRPLTWAFRSASLVHCVSCLHYLCLSREYVGCMHACMRARGDEEDRGRRRDGE